LLAVLIPTRGAAVSIRFPGETDAYRAARNELLDREVALRREMEAVAAARRDLPPGGIVPDDYVFQGAGPDGVASDVRLSELFAPGRDSLVIYNFMFPRASNDDRAGPTTGASALLPCRRARARHALRCSTSSTGRPITLPTV
jgi:predicted dithiol-disulfide oxidoreductase (DUF899 family)